METIKLDLKNIVNGSKIKYSDFLEIRTSINQQPDGIEIEYISESLTTLNLGRLVRCSQCRRMRKDQVMREETVPVKITDSRDIQDIYYRRFVIIPNNPSGYIPVCLYCRSPFAELKPKE